VLDQPVCSMLVYYFNITRPDSQFLCTRVHILWFSVAWGSATFWWQSNACNCSMFCTCTRSHSPHNVVHLSWCLYSPAFAHTEFDKNAAFA